METVLLVVHIIVAVALVAVVLLQRSEGGGLGIGGGGGGGGGGFMTSRGAADALTRTTAYLAAAFFVTSITLTVIGRGGEQPGSILDVVDDSQVPAISEPVLPATPEESEIPSVPNP